MADFKPINSYSPSPLSRYSAGHQKARPKIIGLLVVILVVGIGVSNMVISRLETRALARVTDISDVDLFAPYYAKVSQETDKAKLLRVGQVFMQKHDYNVAAAHFSRASELDSNDRNAAYAWAYALLKAKKDAPSAEDMKALHAAIDRAEAIDPFFVPMLQIKLAVAEAEKNEEVSAATKARIETLQKD